MSSTGLGFNLKSTGFKVKNNPEVLYLTDVPVNNYIGTIVFFKLVNNVPVVVSNVAGNVNYQKGEIKLNPVIFTESSIESGIQIEAVPESNDVISVRDIYLELNIPKMTIDMISDTLSSGENISGSQYPTTSSYANNQYTR